MLQVRVQATVALDDRGRLSLPVELRRALEVHRVHSLVLHGVGDGLWGWTPDDYAKVEARLVGHDPFAADVVDFVHAVLATNEEVPIDQAGRIRIPGELRELAGITKEVRLFSVAGRIELWDPVRWKERLQQARARGATLPPAPGTAVPAGGAA